MKATKKQIAERKKGLSFRMKLISLNPELDVVYTRADIDMMQACEDLWMCSPDLPFYLYKNELSVCQAWKEIHDDLLAKTGLRHKVCMAMRDKDAEIPSFLVRVVPIDTRSQK